MKMPQVKLLAAILLASSITAHPAFGADHPVTLWELKGQSNRIFILGSVHMMRDSDYPIPAVIYSAFDEAETLIMELDLDDLDPLAISSLVLELGMIGDGESLEDKIGESAYAEAAKMASEIQIPLATLAKSKPWLAAVTVESMMLMRIGFDQSNGIEMHLMSKLKDGSKEILGLETERQQLEILDSLSLNTQRDMLLQTLADAGEIEDILDELIDAWRHGDIDYMDETLLSEMVDDKELYESIVVARNRNWVEQIDALLDDRDDYLIIVGTMHLVGKDGVPTLLKNRGLDIRQMYQN